jgi:hypothetical protein
MNQIGTTQIYCTIAIDSNSLQSAQYCLNFVVMVTTTTTTTSTSTSTSSTSTTSTSSTSTSTTTTGLSRFNLFLYQSEYFFSSYYNNL